MEYHDRKIVALASSQIFAVIADVEHYHQFLPWCQASRITARLAENHYIAELLVGLGVIRDRLVSEVIVNPERQRVEMRTPTHPNHLKKAHQAVKSLHAFWQLTPIAQNQETEIEFYINFTMGSTLYEQMMAALMKPAVRSMSDAFVARAQASCRSQTG